MIIQYIQAALENARYEIIDDEEPYYGEVPGLDGVWSSGNTLEECRKNLENVIDEWVIVRLAKGLPIPQIGSHGIKTPGEMSVA
ncbi:MAG: type II toxin-antitoxin system HicB family antitoxin [Methanosarcinaceae archaeon]|nr:type II toxin-antitoxin system HicB family antitoxin [Methanosarcinaceae archaeon]